MQTRASAAWAVALAELCCRCKSVRLVTLVVWLFGSAGPTDVRAWEKRAADVRAALVLRGRGCVVFAYKFL